MVKTGDAALNDYFQGTISASMIIAETARTERSQKDVADLLCPSFFLLLQALVLQTALRVLAAINGHLRTFITVLTFCHSDLPQALEQITLQLQADNLSSIRAEQAENLSSGI